MSYSSYYAEAEHGKWEIELLKYPKEEDWLLCKQLALNTVWKGSEKAPSEEWKKKILTAEHSPIRCLWFVIKMVGIPYYISNHFVRHKHGVEHFVSSQRNDRQQMYDRTQAPQDAPVNHILYVNAQELMNMAHRRLCGQADEKTQEIMQAICARVEWACPEFVGLLVPMCKYRGKCPEMKPCGRLK